MRPTLTVSIRLNTNHWPATNRLDKEIKEFLSSRFPNVSARTSVNTSKDLAAAKMEDVPGGSMNSVTLWLTGDHDTRDDYLDLVLERLLEALRPSFPEGLEVNRWPQR